MKEKLTQFSKGVFQFEKPSLLFSQDSIEFAVETGTVYEGSITLTTEKEEKIKGIAYSDEHFFKVKNSSFCGTEVNIEYEFDARECIPGETHTGNLKIVSNLGEFEKTFLAKVEMPYFETSMGKVKDLFQFANLAKKDWIEAVKLFKTEEFYKKLLYHDEKNQLLYKSMIKSVSTSHALEEFLISVHKKVRTNFSVDKSILEYKNISETWKDCIVISKDNWGYTELKASSESDFIELEHKLFWTDNFIGDQYRLNFIIDQSKLKQGDNRGNIVIKTPYQSFQIEVIVSMESDRKLENRSLKAHTRSVVFTRNYLVFRMNRIASDCYVEGMKQLLNEYYEASCMDEYYLLKAHLAISEGNEEDIQDVLTKLEKRKELWEDELFYLSAYEYIYAMAKKDVATIEDANDKIDELYKKTEGDWRIFWFLLNIDSNFMENNELRYEAILSLLEKGVKSPILYFEVATIWNQNASYFTELTEATKRVVNWMIKEDFETLGVMEQYVYLASKLKSYQPTAFWNLKKIYQKSKSPKVLQALVSMLIKSQKSGEKYFEWYQLGVEKQMRITQLYEFYMYSIQEDMDIIFPDSVLQYFSMNFTMEENKKAFFYANLLRHKEEYESFYSSYEAGMFEFGKHELSKRNINSNLASIYEEMIQCNKLDEEDKKNLSYVMFRNELTVRNQDIIGAVVVHGELEGETYVPVEDGKAQLSIFTDSAKVLLVDRKSNRYDQTIDYTLKKYVQVNNYAESFYTVAKDNGMLLLHLNEQVENFRKYSKIASDVRKRLVLLEELKSDYKWSCYAKLVEYYYESLELEELDRLLAQVEFSALGEKDRIRMFELCVTRKIDVDLLSVLEQYGYEKIQVKKLYKFLTNYLEKNQEEELPVILVCICFFLLNKGKQNTEILKILVKNYIGNLEELRLIWEKAKETKLDVTSLEEQLISQTLFTESGRKNIIPVFLSYFQKKNADPFVIKAFMTYYSYKFIVKDRVIQPELLNLMKSYIKHNNNRFVMLALLKEYSMAENLTKEEIDFVEIHMLEFIKQKLILPFFKEFKKVLPMPFELANKYYVTYVTDPKSQVIIHYSVENGTGNKLAFKEEKMKNVFYGIFVKEFVLFHNDRLQYYISEKKDDVSSITESTQFTYQDDMSGEESEYTMLNSILVANDVQDSTAALELLKQYITTGYIITEKFTRLD